MKKILLLVTGMLLAVIVAGCTDSNTESKDPVVYTPPGVILEQIDKEESFAFVIGDEDCPACQSYLKAALTDLQKKSDLTLQYIELKGIEEKKEEYADIQVLIEDHLDGQFEATPTTYFMIDGKLKEVSVGALEYEDLLELHNRHIKIKN